MGEEVTWGCLELFNEVPYKLCSSSIIIITVIKIKEDEIIGTHSTHRRRRKPKNTGSVSMRSTDGPRCSWKCVIILDFKNEIVGFSFFSLFSWVSAQRFCLVTEGSGFRISDCIPAILSQASFFLTAQPENCWIISPVSVTSLLLQPTISFPHNLSSWDLW